MHDYVQSFQPSLLLFSSLKALLLFFSWSCRACSWILKLKPDSTLSKFFLYIIYIHVSSLLYSMMIIITMTVMVLVVIVIVSQHHHITQSPSLSFPLFRTLLPIFWLSLFFYSWLNWQGRVVVKCLIILSLSPWACVLLPIIHLCLSNCMRQQSLLSSFKVHIVFQLERRIILACYYINIVSLRIVNILSACLNFPAKMFDFYINFCRSASFT